jgi:hypothetical protein
VAITPSAHAPDVSWIVDPSLIVDRMSDALVGTLGEELAFNYLRQQVRANRGLLAFHTSGKPDDTWTLQWLNRDHETNAPCDIIANSASGDTVYIEVKSTTDWTKSSFHISIGEIDLARRSPNNFYVFFVALDFSGKCSFRLISNILAKVKESEFALIVETGAHHMSGSAPQ